MIVVLGIPAVFALIKGETDFQNRELHIIQLAVVSMMVDNHISTIPDPVTVPTNDMGAFPDATALPEAKGLLVGDKAGYLLYGHDKTPDGEPEPIVNYVTFAKTTWTYTVTSDGTLIQDDKAER